MHSLLSSDRTEAPGTKPFIILSLAWALIWSVRGRMSRTVIIALVALLLGWLGDLALMAEGENWFLVLAPHRGGMLVPVVVYGAVVGTMAIASTRCAPAVTIGATLFLLSDSLLALNKFVPDAGILESGFLIMLSYIAAQGLIVLGLVRSELSPSSQDPRLSAYRAATEG